MVQTQERRERGAETSCWRRRALMLVVATIAGVGAVAGGIGPALATCTLAGCQCGQEFSITAELATDISSEPMLVGEAEWRPTDANVRRGPPIPINPAEAGRLWNTSGTAYITMVDRCSKETVEALVQPTGPIWETEMLTVTHWVGRLSKRSTSVNDALRTIKRNFGQVAERMRQQR